jgi:hypothetical protein
MVSLRTSVSPCPVCHQTDRAYTLQTADKTGTLSFVPPPPPEVQAVLLRYQCAGIVLAGIAVILSIVILATRFFAGCSTVTLVPAFLESDLLTRGDEEARHRSSLWEQTIGKRERLRLDAREIPRGRECFAPGTSGLCLTWISFLSSRLPQRLLFSSQTHTFPDLQI